MISQSFLHTTETHLLKIPMYSIHLGDTGAEGETETHMAWVVTATRLSVFPLQVEKMWDTEQVVTATALVLIFNIAENFKQTQVVTATEF